MSPSPLRIPGSPPEAPLEEFRGLQIAWSVKDLGVHVITQHPGPRAAVRRLPAATATVWPPRGKSPSPRPLWRDLRGLELPFGRLHL